MWRAMIGLPSRIGRAFSLFRFNTPPKLDTRFTRVRSAIQPIPPSMRDSIAGAGFN